MIDSTLLEKVVNTTYDEEQKKAISVGFCPNCLPRRVDYRILETFYSEDFQMDVHRVKCSDVVNCEWEAVVPTYRSDNGLENFFNS